MSWLPLFWLSSTSLLSLLLSLTSLLSLSLSLLLLLFLLLTVVDGLMELILLLLLLLLLSLGLLLWLLLLPLRLLLWQRRFHVVASRTTLGLFQTDVAVVCFINCCSFCSTAKVIWFLGHLKENQHTVWKLLCDYLKKTWQILSAKSPYDAFAVSFCLVNESCCDFCGRNHDV